MNELSMALLFLKRDLRRAFLTLAGVALSAFLLLTLLSLSISLHAFFEERVDAFGRDVVVVMGTSLEGLSFGSVQLLSKEDVSFFSRFGPVVPFSFSMAEVGWKGERYLIGVTCTTPEVFRLWPALYVLREGKPFSSGEAVLGWEVWKEVMEGIGVGDSIWVNGKRYRVSGLLERMGKLSSSPDDSAIMLPLEDCEELFPALYGGGKYLAVAVKGDVDRIREEGKAYLERRYGKDTFSFMDATLLSSTLSTLLSAVDAVLALFILFALLIASLGLFNTVQYSMYEKRKEIGLLRALGATPAFVERTFLLEALLLATFGLLVGLFFAKALLTAIHQPLHWQAFLLSIPLLFLSAFLSVKLSISSYARREVVELLRD